ncbi:MAG: hypothetical protein NVSMB48_23690 [Marmoricola sp.]
MPPVKATGRIPIYCSDACRKAAYEARRLRKPQAFTVKVVETKTTVEELHSAETCANRLLESAWNVRALLVELARRIDRDGFSDTDWIALGYGFDRLDEALGALVRRRGSRR